MPQVRVVVAAASVVVVVVVCRRLFRAVYLLCSGRTVGYEMVHGLTVVTTLGLRSQCAFGCYVVGEFAAVVAPAREIFELISVSNTG